MSHLHYKAVDIVKVRLNCAAAICGAGWRFLYRVTAHHVQVGSAALPVALDDDASICARDGRRTLRNGNNFRRSLIDFHAACHEWFCPGVKSTCSLHFYPPSHVVWCLSGWRRKDLALQALLIFCGELFGSLKRPVAAPSYFNGLFRRCQRGNNEVGIGFC